MCRNPSFKMTAAHGLKAVDICQWPIIDADVWLHWCSVWSRPPRIVNIQSHNPIPDKCLVLKSTLRIILILKNPKNRLLPIFQHDFTLNCQIRLFDAEKWIFFSKPWYFASTNDYDNASHVILIRCLTGILSCSHIK